MRKKVIDIFFVILLFIEFITAVLLLAQRQDTIVFFSIAFIIVGTIMNWRKFFNR